MTSKKIQRLTVLSVLAALTVVISFVPLKTLGLEITFSMVPVAIAAICYGPVGGAVIGGVFGVVSFLQCLGYSQFGAVLLGINPFLTLLVCIPTRIAAGFLAGVIFSAVKKLSSSNVPATLAASLLAPVLNSLLFTSTLVLFFYNTDYIQGFAELLGAANPFIFMVLFVGVNGLVEIACGFVVAFPCAKAISAFLKRLGS